MEKTKDLYCYSCKGDDQVPDYEWDADINTMTVVEMIENGYPIDELSKRAKLPSLAGFLNEMMGRKQYSVEMTAGFAGLNPATIHKIMTQKITPSRNALLRLALALELSFDETQTLLKAGSCAALSGSRHRDLYIIKGLEEHLSFVEVNDLLTENGFVDLSR